MDSKIYIVRVTAKQEHIVSRLIYQEGSIRKKEGESRIYSVLCSPNLKGYVLVEADSAGAVQEVLKRVPRTKGLVLRERGNLESAGTISIEELEKILKPTPIVEKVSKGDLVEIISGPFKNEKARVAKIDKDKDEITVELVEAAVPIPITVKGDDIRILRKEGVKDEETHD
ncbi:MAG: transcription elongation factor Spt5 [Candidatus Altiarchaeales archaeon]|mgnify:CR=1 FL=1|nr:MAG: transcription elongation factor Spt5 [Candidatus Altiarchaeales archaeon]